jgi:multiple sugar transport system permease protein
MDTSINLETTPTPATTMRRRRRARSDGLAAYAFLLPNLLGFLVFTLGPLVASLVVSFFDWQIGVFNNPPAFIGMGNYVKIFSQDPIFYTVVLNTIVYALFYVSLNIVVSLGIALWLSTLRRWRNFFRVLFFIPVMTPLVGVTLVWALMYDQHGIINQTLSTLFNVPGPDWTGSMQWAMPAIIFLSVWQGFGYNMLVFSAGLQGIPPQYYEAAAIDGAGRWRRFWHITLPQLSPSLFFGIVLTIITSLQVFDQAYILTKGGPGNATTTLVLYLFQSGFQYFHMGYASSIAWVLFIMIMLLTTVQFVAQRKWVYYEA